MYNIICGLVMPTFDDFQYFFMLDVVGISKFTMSISGFISGIMMIFAIFSY
jgi:hypothetical protein